MKKAYRTFTMAIGHYGLNSKRPIVAAGERFGYALSISKEIFQWATKPELARNVLEAVPWMRYWNWTNYIKGHVISVLFSFPQLHYFVFSWGIGNRTPIKGFKGLCPTVRRSPKYISDTPYNKLTIAKKRVFCYCFTLYTGQESV